MATKELVAAGTWRLETVQRPSDIRETMRLAERMMSAVLTARRPRLKWAKHLVLLIEGDLSPPEAIPLPLASALIFSVPARNHGGIIGRELSDVARRLERTPDLKGRVLRELEAAGLVALQEQHVMGERIFRRARRTPAGHDRVLCSPVLGTEPYTDHWVDPRLSSAFDGEFEAAFGWTWDVAWGLDSWG